MTHMPHKEWKALPPTALVGKGKEGIHHHFPAKLIDQSGMLKQDTVNKHFDMVHCNFEKVDDDKVVPP